MAKSKYKSKLLFCNNVDNLSVMNRGDFLRKSLLHNPNSVVAFAEERQDKLG